MRHRALAAVTAALIGCVTAAHAQQGHAQHDHANRHVQGPTPVAPTTDSRVLVNLPDPLAAHMLANMRDHLLALREIQDSLGQGQADRAAHIAETRLGMSSLDLHGAHEVAQFMPPGMQQAGTAMHKAASRFAIVVTDAAVTGDMKPVFSALADITAACVACHAGYRVK
ncbi:MAG: hypothetical protein AB7O80_04770 [Acetobacteraceae bacterium]